MNWHKTTINDLVDFHDDRRVPLSAIERSSFQGEYRYYGAQGVIDHVREYRYDGEYILVAEDGANLVTRNEPIAQIASGRFWVNNHAHAIQASEGKSTNWYVCALLNWLNLSPYVTGAAQPKLSQKNLRAVKVRVPDYETQIRVTNILSKYDSLVEFNRRRISLLEEATQQIYKEWFVRLRFPGHESSRFENGLPNGWKRKSIKSMCQSVNYGFTASATKDPVGPKFLRITDIVPETINWERVPFCEIESHKFEQFRLASGDIVIARTGATVGYAKRIHKRFPDTVFASYLVRLRPQTEDLSFIMGLFVESDMYKRFILANVGGAAQPNANAQVISRAMLIVPPEGIQVAFREVAEPMLDLRDNLMEQNFRLAEARNLLLPRLMSGAIEV